MSNRHPRSLTALLALVLLPTSALAQPENEIDWQRAAERAEWSWSDERATPLYGISQSRGLFDSIRIDCLLVDGFRQFVYSIRRDGETVYSWKGHAATVFRVIDDRLYYADFHPSRTGGDLVAVDLTTGKPLWNSPLKALGPIQHFAYRNHLNLDASRQVVTVYGNEGFGRYLEIKDAETGRTVGHRIFEKEQ